jgi:hypothetical protein
MAAMTLILLLASCRVCVVETRTDEREAGDQFRHVACVVAGRMCPSARMRKTYDFDNSLDHVIVHCLVAIKNVT